MKNMTEHVTTENTLHKEQIEQLAAVLHQPEQLKGKIRSHVEKI